MTALIDDNQYGRVRDFKQLLSSYQRNRDLVSVGAYAAGSDPMLDRAIRLYPQMEDFLQQDIMERSSYEDACLQLKMMLPS
ncbi:flagellar biosynthesis/type III secretory pathway ATPase [Ewingella americana]